MLTFRGEHVQLIPEAPLGIRHEAGQGCVLRQPECSAIPSLFPLLRQPTGVFKSNQVPQVR